MAGGEKERSSVDRGRFWFEGKNVCGAVSNQASVCVRDPGHVGCHEVYIGGDGRRWWGDAVDDARLYRIVYSDGVTGAALTGERTRELLLQRLKNNDSYRRRAIVPSGLLDA